MSRNKSTRTTLATGLALAVLASAVLAVAMTGAAGEPETRVMSPPGTGPSAATTALTPHRDESCGFEIRVPDGWSSLGSSRMGGVTWGVTLTDGRRYIATRCCDSATLDLGAYHRQKTAAGDTLVGTETISGVEMRHYTSSSSMTLGMAATDYVFESGARFKGIQFLSCDAATVEQVMSQLKVL